MASCNVFVKRRESCLFLCFLGALLFLLRAERGLWLSVRTPPEVSASAVV
jgi:hypothetical protein